MNASCYAKGTTRVLTKHDIGANLAPGTMQITGLLDGGNNASIKILIKHSKSQKFEWLQHNVHGFGLAYETSEITGIGDWEFTGYYRIENVVPNGVIDGVAFGILYRDGSGNY